MKIRSWREDNNETEYNKKRVSERRIENTVKERDSEERVEYGVQVSWVSTIVNSVEVSKKRKKEVERN